MKISLVVQVPNILQHLTGGVGISNMIVKIQRDEYMGFEDLCNYKA